MKNSEELIDFTPIEELFSMKEILDMVMEIKPQEHYCYIHSCEFAINMARKYPSIEYHEGIITQGLFVHAWNSIVKNGRRYYFDFTRYFLAHKYKVEINYQAILLRTYSPKEIFKLMFKKNIQCCQIEKDGTYKKYIDKNFKEEKEKIDQLITINKKIKEHEKKHEIFTPCVSY